MPIQKKSRQGSNSTAAKLISRANSSKTLNHSLCNNSEYPSNGNAASSIHEINHNTIENYGDGLTAKQQQQLERNAFLDTQTKDQLKQECRRRGQKTTGNKTELLQRLGYKMSLEQKIKQSQSLSNLRQTNSSQNMKQSQSSPNGSVASGKNKTQRDREKLKAERETLTIIRRPVMTLTYFLYECLFLIRELVYNLLNHKKLIALFLSLVSITTVFYHIPGPHQALFDIVRANLFFIVYWTGLGVLSSVGLGTGLHTFLLYLGPHIASVTLAAYECNSLNFPSPPYPDEIICPETTNPKFIPSLWNIMSKVRPEAFLWGAGTALGELPPYFMAKAARLSGYDPDDAEDLKEFEELQKKKQTGEKLNMFDRAKLFMEKIVERVGFFGILACASIPNPLFDLAGITCGHFLVPFWTFFGATLIGKAVIKMHIQKIFVIVAFDETLLAKAVDLMALVPFIGKKLQEPFKSFLKNQKIKLHRGQLNKSQMESGNLLQRLFEKFVIAMIVYFVLSIINSFAQSYHKRIHKKLTGQPAGKGNNYSNQQQQKLARD